MRLNLVFYGEDKTVIYETSHSSKKRHIEGKPHLDTELGAAS